MRLVRRLEQRTLGHNEMPPYGHGPQAWQTPVCALKFRQCISAITFEVSNLVERTPECMS